MAAHGDDGSRTVRRALVPCVRRVSVDEPGRYDAGIPRGTAALALDLATEAAEAASRLTGVAHRVDPAAVLAHLLLPLVVGDEPTPSAPRRRARRRLGPRRRARRGRGPARACSSPSRRRPTPRRWPRAAQECRLPVTPYRTGAAAWTRPRDDAGGASPGRPSGRRHGARPDGDVGRTAVHRACSPTGAPESRRSSRPSGPTGCGGRPASSPRSRSGKRRVPWDLRERDDRARVRGGGRPGRRARRVVLRPRPAQPRVPDRRAAGGSTRDLRVIVDPGVPARARPWVAFGRGVHAASGLGMVAGAPTPALLAYPDPLAGLAAFDRRPRAPSAGAARRATSRSAWPAPSPRCSPSAGAAARRRSIADAIAQLAPPGPAAAARTLSSPGSA